MLPSLIRDWVGDVDAFEDQYWGKAPGIFRSAAISPFTITDADRVIQEGVLRDPYVRFLNYDKSTGQDALPQPTAPRFMSSVGYNGYMDKEKVRSLMQEGGTFFLEAMEHWHEPTRELVSSLSREFHRAIATFFFVTPAGNQGAALHRDSPHVFMIQVSGSKEWHVYDGPKDGDWPDLVSPEESPAHVLEGVLQPGDVLYVPRGFAHKGVAQSSTSSHLTVVVMEPDAYQLVDSLAKFLRSGLDLPRRPIGDGELAEAAERVLQHFRSRIRDLTAADVLNHARGDRISKMLPTQAEWSLTDLQ